MGDLFCDIIAQMGTAAFADGRRLIEQYSADYLEMDRHRVEDRMFNDPSLRLLISTIGFGIGMDCPDIDHVILWGAPNTILEYWQIVGRAGRDGRQCLSTMYVYPASLIKASAEMKELVQNGGSKCLRSMVLEHLTLTNKENTNSISEIVSCKCHCCQVCKINCNAMSSMCSKHLHVLLHNEL